MVRAMRMILGWRHTNAGRKSGMIPEKAAGQGESSAMSINRLVEDLEI